MTDIDIFSTDNQDYGAWCVLYNPTFGNESTSFSNFDVARDSAVQVRQHVSSETITDEGYRVDSGFWSSRVQLEFASTAEDIVRSLPIAADVSGDSDVLTLAMRVLVGNESSIYANLKWLEII
jgi:hypothetical protein